MNLVFETRAAWLAWRNDGLGASDTPIIFGISKYKKPFQLFETKSGRVPLDESTNWAQERGNNLEPLARTKWAARWNLVMGLDDDQEETFEPCNRQSPEHSHFRASLDGITRSGDVFIEIKFQGAEAHANVAKGIIEPAYYAQMQHQFLVVPEAKEAYLVSINAAEEIAWHRVTRDEALIAEILHRGNTFWGHVKANLWPGEVSTLQEKFDALETIRNEIKVLEESKEKLEQEIYGSGVEVCGRWRVTTIEKKGAVDYAKIPQLKDVDLEQYRKTSSTYKKITLAKG